MKTEMFTRDQAQNEMIGLSTGDNTESIIKPLGSFNDTAVNDVAEEIVQFSGPCPNCQVICETNMKVTGNCFLFNFQYNVFNSDDALNLNYYRYSILQASCDYGYIM